MSLWDFWFSKAVAETAKEVRKEKARKNEQKQRINYGYSDREKIVNYVNNINVTVPPYNYTYQFDIDSELSAEFTKLLVIPSELDDRQKILSRLRLNPNNITLNILMIEKLISLLDSYYFYPFGDEDGANELYFIEECRYYIEKTLPYVHMLPSGIGNKYLLLSIDAELYILQGNYVCALKRYFEILSWPQMIMNIYRESWAYNCTEDLYGYVVANIMSIFKILDLRQENNDISNLFHEVLQYQRKLNQKYINQKYIVDDYTQARSDTYFPNTKFTGFHFYNTRTNGSLLEWTDESNFYTDYYAFSKHELEHGALSILTNAPISKEHIESQRQPVLELLNGNNCKTDFNAFSE